MADKRFVWQGNDREGLRVQGTMQAPSKHAVSQHLTRQRIRPTRIYRDFQWPAWFTAKQIQATDITQMTRQLATLLHAGVPLLQAFEILGKGLPASDFKTLLLDIRHQIERGSALHQALGQHQAFDTFYCNLVAAGELAGRLDTMLERLAKHREKSQTIRSAVKSALIYPSTVLTIAVVVTVLLLTFVVPAFQNIFNSFEAELPWLTRLVIGLSESLQQFGGYALVAGVLTSHLLLRHYRTNTNWQIYMHTAVLRLPIAGPLIRQACTARWTRTSATLFAAGIPLTEALDAVKGVTGNWVYQSATQEIQSQLIRGSSISRALQSFDHLFSPMVIQMVAIGEESGSLDLMLDKTAEYYEQALESAVASLSTLMEPVIMVILGVLIGGLVMALYLPIFQLGQVV